MPEGDTIHRIARTLRPLVVGHEVTRVEAKRLEVPSLAHTCIEEIEARGKNLLIHFDNGATLATHLRMHGSWHAYRQGARFKKPRSQAVAIVETNEWCCVCFDAPVVELLRTKALSLHPRLAKLGEDPIAESFDAEKAANDLLRVPTHAIGVAIMDQRALAGVGNVYKSELLFRLRINPFAPISSLSFDERFALVQETQTWMRFNLTTRSRTLTGSNFPGARHFVYERKGDECRVCRSPIQMRRQGDDTRSTYFCARCQKVDEASLERDSPTS